MYHPSCESRWRNQRRITSLRRLFAVLTLTAAAVGVFFFRWWTG